MQQFLVAAKNLKATSLAVPILLAVLLLSLSINFVGTPRVPSLLLEDVVLLILSSICFCLACPKV
jgi:hypothetical protein